MFAGKITIKSKKNKKFLNKCLQFLFFSEFPKYDKPDGICIIGMVRSLVFGSSVNSYSVNSGLFYDFH